MVTKYQMISYLAEDTAKEIAKNGQEWTRYLTTAARLYKYPFNEQILIFAQRPDATACASLELWNEKMNCWVNRGAKGIALLDTENSYTREIKINFLRPTESHSIPTNSAPANVIPPASNIAA